LTIDPLVGFVTMLTSMFLHGGWMHLLGNLWFLWIFGPSVEEELGAKRFAALYLASGVAAALAQAMFDPFARIPMLGASGAIGGVLAAYVSLHPRRRIDTLAFVFVWPIPALFFVLEWFAINLFRGVGALTAVNGDGVAWWAHVGGFLAGLVLVRLLFPRAPKQTATRRLPPRDVIVRGANGETIAARTLRPHDEEFESVRVYRL
jgi:membrane associated rhomboid family serine protease